MPELASSFSPLPFSEWATTGQLGDDPDAGYADYLREGFLKAGYAPDEFEEAVRQDHMRAVAKRGGDPNAVYQSKPLDFDTALQGLTDEARSLPQWEQVQSYLDDRSEDKLPVATEAANALTDALRRRKVAAGELPFAKVRKEGELQEGEDPYELIAGDMATQMANPLEALKASARFGGVRLSDAFEAAQLLAPAPGTNGKPRYVAERQDRTTLALSTIAETDPTVAEALDAQALRQSGRLGTLGYNMDRASSWVTEKLAQSGMMGDEAEIGGEDQQARRLRVQALAEQDEDTLAAALQTSLVASGVLDPGDEPQQDDVKAAAARLADERAMAQGYIPFDAENLGNNIRLQPVGSPVIHPALYANDELFAQAMAERPELKNSEKKHLEKSRQGFLARNFDRYDKVLSDSPDQAAAWTLAKQQGYAAKTPKHEILQEFVKDPDNYSALATRAGGIVDSLVDSIGGAIAAIPALMGNEAATGYLLESQAKQSQRRALREVFGDPAGIWQDVGEAIAPAIVDVGLTALISAGATPLAGGGYLAAKRGAGMTLKGLGKAITSNILRTSDDISAEIVAKRLSVQGLLKTKDAPVTEIIKGFNEIMDNSVTQALGRGIAAGLPAANRAAGSTYATLYAAMPDDLTHEQKHDRALGGALTSAAVNFLGTGAFSAIGRGGLEDAFTKGASYRQLKDLYASIANRKLSDATFNEVLKKQVAAGLSTVRKGLLKNTALGMADEALEEGSIEFVDSFVEDAALNKDTPMVERWKRAGHAALVGGILGGGVEAVKLGGDYARSAVAPNAPMSRATRNTLRTVENQFINDLATKLKDTGSPLTAEAIRQNFARNRREVANMASRSQANFTARQKAVADTAWEEAQGRVAEQPLLLESGGEIAEGQPVFVLKPNGQVRMQGTFAGKDEAGRNLVQRDGKVIATDSTVHPAPAPGAQQSTIVGYTSERIASKDIAAGTALPRGAEFVDPTNVVLPEGSSIPKKGKKGKTAPAPLPFAPGEPITYAYTFTPPGASKPTTEQRTGIFNGLDENGLAIVLVPAPGNRSKPGAYRYDKQGRLVRNDVDEAARGWSPVEEIQKAPGTVEEVIAAVEAADLAPAVEPAPVAEPPAQQPATPTPQAALVAALEGGYPSGPSGSRRTALAKAVGLTSKAGTAAIRNAAAEALGVSTKGTAKEVEARIVEAAALTADPEVDEQVNEEPTLDRDTPPDAEEPLRAPGVDLSAQIAQRYPNLAEDTRAALAMDAESLYRWLLGRAPIGTTLEINPATDPDKGYSMATVWADGHTVRVDPVALYLNAMQVAQGLKPNEAPVLSRGFVNENLIYAHAEAILASHELGHIAGFDALTDEEVAYMASQLKPTDYEAVIEDYFPTDDGKKQARTDLKNDKTINTNTGLPQSEATKRGLSEEWLRMWLEKTTLGFTQEEFSNFLRGNPSRLRIAGKYLGGVFRAMANRMDFKRNYNPTLHAYLNRVSSEMRLLRAGYRLGMPVAGFDANNPAATLELMKMMLRNDNLRPEDLPGAATGAVLRAPTPSSLRHAALEEKHNAGTITPAEVQEAGRLVEERARESGYNPTPWWHSGKFDPNKNPVPTIKGGKKSKSNMQLDFGFHVAESEKEAATYLPRKGGATTKVFLADGWRGGSILDLSDEANWIVTAEEAARFGPLVQKKIEEQRKLNRQVVPEVDPLTQETPVYPSQLEKILSGVGPQDAVAALRMAGVTGVQYTARANYGNGRYRPFKAVVVTDAANQIKSAEPFTGTPLDGRFDPQQDSILRSPSAMDAAYLQAVNSGDMATAQRMVEDRLKDMGALWHGTPSGDLRGGRTGLHVGTRQAAMEALEARIGIPADGKGWNGDREYGETLLAGKDHINSGQFGKYRLSGFNMDAPKEDYYPSKMPTVGEGVSIDPKWKPWLRPVLIVGEMTNNKWHPISDEAANRRIKRKRGAYYKNEGEDSGSISAVLPDGGHIRVKLADPVTYDEQGNVIPLSQRFNPQSDSILRAPVAGFEKLPDMVLAPLLEMPGGDPKAPGFRKPVGTFARWIQGETDPRLLEYMKERDRFMTLAGGRVADFAKNFDAGVKEIYGDGTPDWALIARAAGSDRVKAGGRATITDMDWLQEEDLLLAEALRNNAQDQTIDEDIRALNEEALHQAHEFKLNMQREWEWSKLEADRNVALADLAKLPGSATLVETLLTARTKVLAPLKQLITDPIGGEPDLDFSISNEGDIYITKAYKFFQLEGYAEMVKHHPEMEALRKGAAEYMEKSYVHQRALNLIKTDKLSRAEAKRRAEEELLISNTGHTVSMGQHMLNQWLEEMGGASPQASNTKFDSNFMAVVNNLKTKADMPDPLAQVLGVYNDTETREKMLRTILVVHNMAANQVMLRQMRALGEKEGFMASKDVVTQARAKTPLDPTDPDFNPDVHYDPANFDPTKEGRTAYAGWEQWPNRKDNNDLFHDLFAPQEVITSMAAVNEAMTTSPNLNASEQATSALFRASRWLTGVSMGAKTLGSLGFYTRNIVSNAIFFPLIQGLTPLSGYAPGGFSGSASFYSLLGTEAKRQLLRRDSRSEQEIKEELEELTLLGIAGNEMATGIMRDLLKGTVTPKGLIAQVDALTDAKALKIGKEGFKKLMELAKAASVAVDAFYKFAYYKHEVGVMFEARAAATTGDPLLGATDMELKKLAAAKVRKTAQTASETLPLIKSVERSAIGTLFAPFLRFKSEVPRILVNTWRLAQMEYKSGNEALVRRGRQRIQGLIAASTISTLFPIAAAIAAGMWDEEEEAMRDSVPAYLRNNSFLFWRGKDGDWKSTDWTFVNPVAMFADPLARLLTGIFTGRPAEGGVDFAKALVFDQYLDDQILAGAVNNLRANEDPATGKPIWEANDSVSGAFVKAATFLIGDAFAPMVGKKLVEGWSAIGSDHEGFLDSPAGIVLASMAPTKIHKADLNQQYSRYLRERKEEYDRVRGQLGRLMSSKPMTEAAIIDLYDDVVKGTRAVNHDMLRKMRGMEGLGLSRNDIYKIMVDNGVSKNRVNLLRQGVMDRPVLSTELMERMRAHSPITAARLKTLQGYIPKANARYLPLE
jgi:hypothetical protein